MRDSTVEGNPKTLRTSYAEGWSVSFFTCFASLIEFAVINFITVYINRFKAAEEKQREDEKARVEALRAGELKRLLEAEAARCVARFNSTGVEKKVGPRLREFCSSCCFCLALPAAFTQPRTTYFGSPYR